MSNERLKEIRESLLNGSLKLDSIVIRVKENKYIKYSKAKNKNEYTSHLRLFQ